MIRYIVRYYYCCNNILCYIFDWLLYYIFFIFLIGYNNNFFEYTIDGLSIDHQWTIDELLLEYTKIAQKKRFIDGPLTFHRQSVYYKPSMNYRWSINGFTLLWHTIDGSLMTRRLFFINFPYIVNHQ